MKFTFTCSCCGRKFFNAKRFDIAVSDMEDDQLGVVISSASICTWCKDGIVNKINNPNRKKEAR